MRKTSVALIVAAGAAVVGALIWTMLPSREVPPPVEQKAPASRPIKSPKKVPKSVKAKGESASARKAMRPRRVLIEEPVLTPQEARQAERLQAVLDDNDFKAVLASVKEISASTNAALRTKAVEALQFFGKRGLPELTPFVADADNDVAVSAADAVVQALMEFSEEETALKVDYIETLLTMKGLCSQESVERLVGELNAIGVGHEEEVVRMVTRLIEGGAGEMVKGQLKETYEFLTSETYAGQEASDAWCRQHAEEAAADGDAEKSADNVVR